MRQMAENLPITLRLELDAASAEQVIVRFLRDYSEGAGKKRVVVGLSGGLDSAVAAALAVRALGVDNVRPLILPEDATPATELEDANLVARHLGLTTTTLSIQPFLEAFQSVVKPTEELLLGNAKARFRMILLHAEAARRKALVLGTGNKSELLTAYFTKYGDAGVDLQPLGDLYKTQVRQLARHLGLPERLLTKPPTAGLWAGQTDEAELGITYDILDRILLGLELHLAKPLIAQVVGVPVDEVGRIESLRARTQHKRRMPLIPKVGLRTLGVDWRTPTLEA